jgi:predicted alpha/beta-fold hydrolase
VPALVIESEHDPMVLSDTVRPSLAAAPGHLEVRWIADGGHVGFPPGLDVEEQAIGWLLRR